MKSPRCAFLALALVLVCLGFRAGWAKDAPVPSAWAAAAPTIDGIPDDWAGVPRGLDKKTEVEYAFRNDADNLYVLVVFKDPKFLSTINVTGLTLYFNTKGGTDRERGINLRRRTVNGDGLIATLEKQGQVLTEERKQELRQKKEYILYDTDVVDGKGDVLGPAVGSGQSLPPVWRLGRNGQESAFEVRIPLSKREEHPGAIGTAPGQNLWVELEWGGLTKEMRAAKAAQVGERSTRATEGAADFDIQGGGDYSGRSEGGEPQSSLASMLRGPKKHSFAVEIKLAESEK